MRNMISTTGGADMKVTVGQVVRDLRCLRSENTSWRLFDEKQQGVRQVPAYVGVAMRWRIYPFWRCACLIWLLSLLAELQVGVAVAQEYIYDNRGPRNSLNFGPTGAEDRFIAQQFLTGEFTQVASIAIPINPIGSPEGTLDIEIWDDNGSGNPGTFLQSVSSVELSSIPRDAPGPLIFQTPITGLSPNTPYYVVLDNINTVMDGGNHYNVSAVRDDGGANGAAEMLLWDDADWFPASDIFAPAPLYLRMAILASRQELPKPLQAGDSDQDLDFDQMDLVQVQIGGKYLTGQSATWGEGDWDGAPGGQVGSPPPGNGLFDQLDVVTALAARTYLTGPYAAVSPGGTAGDGQTSVVYSDVTGERSIDASPGTEVTSIDIDSEAVIFTPDSATNPALALGQFLTGPYAVVRANGHANDIQLSVVFDPGSGEGEVDTPAGTELTSINIDSDARIFPGAAAANLSASFDNHAFGNISKAAVDSGGRPLGDMELVYTPIPEPSTMLLAVLAIGGLLIRVRGRPGIRQLLFTSLILRRGFSVGRHRQGVNDHCGVRWRRQLQRKMTQHADRKATGETVGIFQVVIND